MSEKIPGIQKETETQGIDLRCENLLIISNSLLNNYGEWKKVELSDDFYTHFGRLLRIVPKEVLAINMRIYFDTKWQEIQIIRRKDRVDIVLGDLTRERLVLGEKDSWIQLPKSQYRDINEHGTPPILIRPATPDDLQRYELAIAITKRDLTHK